MPNKYFLGPSTNIFSTQLPDGTVFPNHLEAVDARPIEFIEWFDLIRDKPWEGCRFADFGCNEGHSTLRIGQTGAQVLGVEGRADAVTRAEYVRDRNAMSNVRFEAGDVSDPSRFGSFDAIYAAGILYHLEDPCGFVEALTRNAKQMIYLCTHVAPADPSELQQSPRFFGALSDTYVHVHRGHDYVVRNFAEPEDTEEYTSRGRRHPRSGVGNSRSVWLTFDSLVKLLDINGFGRICVKSFEPSDLRIRLIAYRTADITLTRMLPEVPSFEDAIRKAMEQDLSFLGTAPGSIVVVGSEPYLGQVTHHLLGHGVTIQGAFVTDPASFHQTALGVPSLTWDEFHMLSPDFVVLATPDYSAIYQELMLLNRSKYLFTSFSQALERFGLL